MRNPVRKTSNRFVKEIDLVKKTDQAVIHKVQDEVKKQGLNLSDGGLMAHKTFENQRNKSRQGIITANIF